MSKWQQCARCRQFFHRLYVIIDPATGLRVRVCDTCERLAMIERNWVPAGPWYAARNAGKQVTR